MVVTAWRIVERRFSARAFDGEGAFRNGGRWTSVGRRVVYASGSIALATLEIVAHLDSMLPLLAYSLFEIGIPESLVGSVDPETLPARWSDYPPPARLTAVGDDWLQTKTSAGLKVPSAIVRVEWNYLLNPVHPAFGRIRIGPEQPYRVDPRLL